MTTTDPTTLAREVLDIQDRHQAMNARTGLGLPIGINDMATLASAAPALARAVLAAADLADQLENYGEELEADGEDGYADAARTDAHRIRAALNGDPA